MLVVGNSYIEIDHVIDLRYPCDMTSKLVIGYTDGSVACVDVHSGKFINRTAGTESGASITTLEGQGGAAKCGRFSGAKRFCRTFLLH